MQRLRLYDYRMSRGPGLCGIPREDIAAVAQIANTAQRRLIYAKEAGDEGWYGSFAEIAFTASRTQPYITLPREIARLELTDVCNCPVPVNNQFMEYLEFGNGRMPKNCSGRAGLTAAYTRNNVPLFVDPPTSPFYVQVFPTNTADVQAVARVLVQGMDEAGNAIYSLDNATQVIGEYVTLASPFATATGKFSQITGIQKDPTVGPVQIMAVDATTGTATLLLTMEPSEQTGWYRRYYFDKLPCSCCATPVSAAQPVIITAIAKLELIPVISDADYFIIQNLEALIEEGQSVRLSEIDGSEAKGESRERHNAAVQLLNGELKHYLGQDDPAVNFKPFGSASFHRVTGGFN